MRSQIKFEEERSLRKGRQKNSLNSPSKAKFILKRCAVEYQKSLTQ